MQHRHRTIVTGLLPIFVAACATGGNDSILLKPTGECLAHDAPAYERTINQALVQMSPELLTGERFAVFSHVYNSQPADGYPIRFLSDGSISGTQYHGYQWSVTERGLQVIEPEHGQASVFSFNRKCTSLSYRSKDQTNPMLQVEIAIVGSRQVSPTSSLETEHIEP